jgi:hypothetical protein
MASSSKPIAEKLEKVERDIKAAENRIRNYEKLQVLCSVNCSEK